MTDKSQQMAIANSMVLIALVKLLDRKKIIDRTEFIESLDKMISKADAKGENLDAIKHLQWVRDQFR